MSNAVESPVPPSARSWRKRWLVSAAEPKPANWRIVHTFDRYMEAKAPRVKGNWPGNSPSAGP